MAKKGLIVLKLNHDCIRQLLLHLEENLDCYENLELNDLMIDGFSKDDIVYTLQKLNEAGYIKAEICCDITGFVEISVMDITWDGHKFLDTIRDNQVWSLTKKALSKFSSVSISFVSTVASQVLTNIITQQLGLSSFKPPV
jgi:hypothetical protein